MGKKIEPGQMLKKARENASLSVRGLAKATLISAGFISKLERGKEKSMSMRAAKLICRKLCLNQDEFFHAFGIIPEDVQKKMKMLGPRIYQDIRSLIP